MSIFEQVTAAFAAEKYDHIAFKNLHHEEFMFVRELYLISRDEFCRSIDKLIEGGWKNWKDIELCTRTSMLWRPDGVMETKS